MARFFATYNWLQLGHRPRLYSALIIGVVAGLCLPARLSIQGRMLLAWDVVAIIYLTLTLTTMFLKNTADALKQLAAQEDQRSWMILIVMTIASFASLIAIFTLLGEIKNLPPLIMRLHIAWGAATVIASWAMMHTIFAVHYAHEYYGDSNADPDQYEAYRGLIFPGNKEPIFSDFMYFSFVVGMTFQVSDVQISSHVLRRLAMVHGILAFFFNTVILALSVNIAAGLLS